MASNIQVQEEEVTSLAKHKLLTLLTFSSILGFLALFLVPFLISLLWPQPSNTNEALKAILIDTVYISEPNDELIKNVVKVLKNRGFEVDVYLGTNVTVNLMKRLTKGYKLIILRVHSSYTHFPRMFLPNNTVVLITGERYVKNKYFREEALEMLVASTVVPELRLAYGYYAITPRFINALNGSFKNAMVIAMGCNTLYTTSMAKAFIDKGAKVYIGWSDYVSAKHMDKALGLLIKLLVVDGITVKNAVNKVNEEIGVDPVYKAKLVYYPLNSGNINIEQIIKP